MFAIAELKLDDLGFDRVVPFEARLTNPLPTGRVDVKGSFGPWFADDPASTPITGKYDFAQADLSTLEGLRGTLKSKGTFDGHIANIHVQGGAEVPDFNLTLGGHPAPLTASFDAVVDGTDGTTRLRKVDALLMKTTISTKGAVTNLPGPGHHSIDLELNIPSGRIEDILQLLSNAKHPVATGNIVAQSTVHLPPGKTSALDRLTLAGRFSLNRAKFLPAMQMKVTELSRRTQGLSRDDAPENVATNVRGTFSMENAVMTIPSLAFDVPGAVVSLTGNCNFKSQALDLRGQLQMEASVSEAVGGFRSIFLKLVDPFFRHQGKTTVPIKVSGKIDAPEVGLNLRNKQ
jgi:hypothetical protein